MKKKEMFVTFALVLGIIGSLAWAMATQVHDAPTAVLMVALAGVILIIAMVATRNSVKESRHPQQ